MFVRSDYKGFDNGRYKYLIVDTDFEDEADVDGSLAEMAVIEVYEKRSLPVAKALIKAMVQASTYYNFPMTKIIEQNNSNPKFAKYKEEIEKYLLLL